jgi:hypothetical protein
VAKLSVFAKIASRPVQSQFLRGGVVVLSVVLLQIAEQLIFCCANIIRESRKMREAKSLLRAKPLVVAT